MPPGLAQNAFPADFWIQPAGGEFVLGISKYDYTTQDVAFIANHDAYGEQNVVLKLTKGLKPKLFDRASGSYQPLEVRMPEGTISFKLEAAGGAILLFAK